VTTPSVKFLEQVRLSNGHQLAATGVRCAVGHLAILAGRGPIVDAGTGNGDDEVARLLRVAATMVRGVAVLTLPNGSVGIERR
jgi:hypothetical protein